MERNKAENMKYGKKYEEIQVNMERNKAANMKYGKKYQGRFLASYLPFNLYPHSIRLRGEYVMETKYTMFVYEDT